MTRYQLMTIAGSSFAQPRHESADAHRPLAVAGPTSKRDRSVTLIGAAAAILAAVMLLAALPTMQAVPGSGEPPAPLAAPAPMALED